MVDSALQCREITALRPLDTPPFAVRLAIHSRRLPPLALCVVSPVTLPAKRCRGITLANSMRDAVRNGRNWDLGAVLAMPEGDL